MGKQAKPGRHKETPADASSRGTPPNPAANLRRLAEEQLAGRESSAADSWTEEDARLLVHELQVHQIELEMQNEELQRAEAEAEAGRARYADLYDFAPVGYFTLDRDGSIREVNRAGAHLLEAEHARLLGRRLGLFAGDLDRPVLSAFLGRVFAGSARESCEVTLRREEPTKSPCFVRIEGTVSRDRRECRAVMMDMSARREAEDALRREEERFRQLYERSPLGYHSLDADGCFVEVNQAWLDALGYAREEVMGRWLGDFLSPGRAEVFRHRFHRFKEAGEAHEEFEMQHGDGSWRVMESDCRIGYHADGTFKQAHCILHDTTERKRALEALRHARAHAENLIETANAMVVALDCEGRITIFNAAAESITGYRRDELRDRNWFEVIVPKDRYPAVWEAFSHLVTGSLPRTLENPILTKSGEERYIAWKNSEILERGQVVGSLSYGIDVTERRRTEAALRESEFMLRESQRVSRVGSYVLNVTTGLWSSTGVLDEILGIGPAHPRTIEGWLDIVHPDHRSEMSRYLQSEVLAQRKPFHREYLIQRPNDGQVNWVLGRGELLLDPDGVPVKMTGTIQDITELKRGEEELHRARRYAESLIETANAIVVAVDREGPRRPPKLPHLWPPQSPPPELT